MANVRYVMQGLDDETTFFIQTKEVIERPEYTNIWILAAYAKENAAVNICDILKTTKADVNVIIGIRNGTTTYEAISAFINAGITTYVFDTANKRNIFHTKTTVAYNDDAAEIIVGSANITSGGLLKNIEGGAVLKLNRSNPEDEKILQELLGYIQIICHNYPDNIKIVSLSDIAEMKQDGLFAEEGTERNYGSSEKSKGDTVNVISSFPVNSSKFPIPVVKRKIKKAIIKKINANNYSVSETCELVWKLNNLTARHLNVKIGTVTNPTGCLSLSKGAYDSVDQKVYFRHTVFKDLIWKTNKIGKEEATADFTIIISAINCGLYELKITHDPRTNTESYKQGNYMTCIHWGKAKSLVQNASLLGKDLLLYKSSDSNSFIIEIE